ncbi:diaminopimelate decarboxylase [Oceanobacillus luteolus]|uniref:diaminopimelate decarboxylase n=1 Tax=Oceanobacillus luteolus TaxID=1274358 RepID=UPI00203C7114|nr:diaminopimelate decarboxylase [Oceanobacillus luteolus]MCM3738816.1 diaminopimelate decarboxylase [Oceanobacillus luteolus]
MIINHHPFSTNDKGNLVIGGVDSLTLAEKYGTPLYVYDVGIIRKNARSFIKAFENLDVKAKVAYASKAFSCIAMVQVANQEGLCLDVVSQGELFTALEAGFPSERIHMHGNNKSRHELKMAIDHQIGCIVIDNFYEIQLLEELLQQEGKTMDVLLRVTPGVELNTHQYIMTGNEDSKFGFNIVNGQADQAFQLLHNHKHIRLKGLHCHIGSQIFETEGFKVAVDLLFEQIEKWLDRDGFKPQVLNLGGGYGIRYTEIDNPLEYNVYVDEIVEAVKKNSERLNILMPEIWIEPGRSIVGNAGVSLYTVGSSKEIPGIRNYISVDGGMADNIRPALYEAKYEAVIANKATVKPIEKASIAGKACESGDMLIWDLPLPETEPGDILAVFATGAYGYAMASNYNRLAKPAVVFVEDGTDKLVVKRETAEDIIKNDLSYE